METGAGEARRRLAEVVRLALRLGCTAFGGPAAHIAMLREEVVLRWRWLTDQHFLDLLGATNLIPGPNSTEMVIHVGYVRAGWRGLLAGGIGFILPAACLVGARAWAYVAYGSTPTAQWLLYGIKPVIMAVVLQALWGLSRTAIRGPLLAAVGLGALGLYLVGWNEIGLLVSGGLLVMLARTLGRLRAGRLLTLLAPTSLPPSPSPPPAGPRRSSATSSCSSSRSARSSTAAATSCWPSCGTTSSPAWAGSPTSSSWTR